MNDNTKLKLKRLQEELLGETEELEMEEEKDAGEVRIKLSPRSKYLEKRLAGLSEMMNKMIEAITNKKMTVNVPDQVTVKNLGDIKIPSEITISNLPEQKEIQKVEITNLPEQEDQAPIFKSFITKATESIGEVFKNLWKDGIVLKQNEKKFPLYVMPVDEKGNVLRQKDIQVFGAGGGGLSKEDKENLQAIANNTANPPAPPAPEGAATDAKLDTLLTELQAINQNTDGLEIKAENINLNTDQLEAKLDTGNTSLAAIQAAVENIPAAPMTDAKGDEIVAAIENISIPAPVGAATAAKQDEQTTAIEAVQEEISNKDIMLTLKSLIQAIAYPAWLDRSANAIRNQVQSGTITTVTTVTTCTTVTGLTNLDGYQAKLQVINQNNSAWANVVRARIS